MTPISHNIATVVGLVSHHDNSRVTSHRINASDYRAAKTVFSVILNGTDFRASGGELLQNTPGLIFTAIIHNNDFVRNSVKSQLKNQMLHCRSYATRFVTRGNN